MNFGRRSSGKCAVAPTVWNNATFTCDWLREAAARFRLAIALQVPVGYQDATGFHQGVPHAVPVRASAPMKGTMLFDPG